MTNRRAQLLRRALAPCALLAALALTACGSDDDGPADLPRLGKKGTALDAGEYRTTKFGPQTTFEVEKGWSTASSELPDYFDIIRAKSVFEAIAFQRVTNVVPPEGELSLAAAPRNLASWIRKHPRLAAGPPKRTTVGGKAATQLDVRVKSAAPRTKRPDSCAGPCLPLFQPSDGRPVTYEPGDKLRFVILEAGDGGVPVTITIAASGETFERFEPQAKKVLSTVKFGGG